MFLNGNSINSFLNRSQLSSVDYMYVWVYMYMYVCITYFTPCDFLKVMALIISKWKAHHNHFYKK